MAVRETYFSGLLESRIEDAAVEMNPAVEALDLVDIYDAFSLLMDTDADGDTAAIHDIEFFHGISPFS